MTTGEGGPTRVPWRKPDADLVDRFHEMVGPMDGLEVRKMFGSPVAFVNGNMAATLIQGTFLVRLPEAERRERLDAGWSQFEPMPGRPMLEYVALPEDVAADAAQAREWIDRAVDYVRTLPPKEPKVRRKRA